MEWILEEYLSADSKSPFRMWMATLDSAVVLRVEARLRRFKLGNLGDHKSVGAGVWEARLSFGPGYRIYFGKADTTIVVLLLGGDKAFQDDDIRKAHRFWREYQEGLT